MVTTPNGSRKAPTRYGGAAASRLWDRSTASDRLVEERRQAAVRRGRRARPDLGADHQPLDRAGRQRQCAGGSAAGLYLTDRRAGVLVTARFTTGIRARRRQLVRRFPYAPLLHVVPARFSLRLLERVRDRVVSDIDYLETQGIRLGLIQVDAVRNRVVVHLHSSRNDARHFLSHRYGPALLIRARDTN
jgi:hypothetical protein